MKNYLFLGIGYIQINETQLDSEASDRFLEFSG